MAVSKVVALVRQVQCIVESPDLLKANGCVDQVSSFLDCFLDHPDSRARLGCARALVQLSSHPGVEVGQLHQAPQVLARLRSKAECGSADAEDRELQSLLEVVLGGGASQGSHDSPSAAFRENVSNAQRSAGEVLRLRVRVAMDEQARSAVRSALVQVEGVVSVTFETDQILVGARAVEFSRDAVFVEDICTAVEDQLQYSGELGDGTVLVVPDIQGGGLPLLIDEDSTRGTDEEPEFLDDDEDDALDADTRNMGNSSAAGMRQASDCESDAVVPGESENEPTYLDDSEDETFEGAQGSSKASSTRPWSFFSQTGFLSQQRLREYEDDPTITARLRRAQLRVERKRQEEQLRLHRVLSVITPLRAIPNGAVIAPGIE